VLDAPEPGIRERVRDFAGGAIWRRYELWRAYEVALPHAAKETLHQARIAGKRLRYTLDFFAEALGPQVEQALGSLTALQDTLGALHDGVVARAYVAALGLTDDGARRRTWRPRRRA
jgi:CHAD domain-containing protein